MSPGTSRLYELQPDPYDITQRRAIRICLFTDVKNAHVLRDKLRKGEIDAAMIRAELVLEPFIVLAAANRAVHQAAHNRLSTRSLSAELVYSLSPSRNISDSLVTFGIADTSKNILVCIFDDKDGSKMKKLAKEIEGRPENLDKLTSIMDLRVIRKISDSLVTFGIADTSKNILVCIFDDKDGSKMKKLAKEIEGRPENLDKLTSIMDLRVIRKIYQLRDEKFNEDTFTDRVLSRIITKDFMS
ncbi:kinase binding protein CGI-121 [Cooperia oncophora]